MRITPPGKNKTPALPYLTDNVFLYFVGTDQSLQVTRACIWNQTFLTPINVSRNSIVTHDNDHYIDINPPNSANSRFMCTTYLRAPADHDRTVCGALDGVSDMADYYDNCTCNSHPA